MLSIKEILEKRVEEIMEYTDNPEKFEAQKVMSGYSGIDDMLTGFKPGELIILAARPSMGKTAFSLNLLSNVALKQSKSVAFFSLEMSADSIVNRILSEVAQIPMYKLTGKEQMTDEDFSKMGEAVSQLGTSNIFIDDK